MSDANDDLDAVYALKSPEDNRRHYDGWAESYDSDFVRDMDYVLPDRVAEAFAAAGPEGPILDVGAGTGLVGARLVALGVGPVDGTDISPGMLAAAAEKDVYDRLFEGDLLGRLPVEDGFYGSAVSAGTFTNGHVGPEGVDEVLRVVRKGGLIALSINGEHWEKAGFKARFATLGDQIAEFRLQEVRYYGDKATGAHAADTGWIAMFRRG
ncbi:methyltransferase domain-containing protein [Alisedimentitalea sp. MJ-SS2]|uniref:class I SAM-dependent DNA methyltransferase n=1 Tax=Aliisedimentitalea sp. MJ-SS2 TaxID=3049795 RepID=UPI002914397D|nr:methyltransferase domain-containing protein [Alisedimentitalea sp. MJ-SS2]MDU8927546.1 methyltransferase domain-containing protein [Alisedimentitalea sp. MJ-SS2]